MCRDKICQGDLTKDCFNVNVLTSDIDDQIICMRTGDVSGVTRGTELED